MKKSCLILLFGLFAVGVISACTAQDGSEAAYYLVDPRFNDLYERLNGAEVLGVPISNKKFVAGTNQEKQYFEGAVLVFDPDDSPHYFLDPVGIDAGFSDLPDTPPGNSAVKYLNGYIIPIEFSQFYEKMGGERWVGFPLTRARLNPDKKTIEQYYENMGFFIFEDDPSSTVHLMPYGLWKCAGECSKYPGVENAGVSRFQRTTVPSPFGEAISRFGTQFTGDAVSEAYQAEDGNIEQIFLNVVLYQDPGSPFGVSLRPITTILEMDFDSYQKKDEQLTGYFRAVNGDAGFFIPTYFMEFIDRYFGFEFSGEPVSRLEEIRDGVYQQCFENYCLLYDSLADSENRVRVLPLGQRYKDLTNNHADKNQTPSVGQVQHSYQIDIWEQLPQISSNEIQQIGACIHHNGDPLENATAELTLTADEKIPQNYQFLPTDSEGCSFLKLDPISADNGTTIDYQVCFEIPEQGQHCKKDSFLIWGNADQTLNDIPQTVASPEPQEVQSVNVDTWELHPQISSAEIQQVGACIHMDHQPVAGMNAQLLIETPNSGVKNYQAPPSDQGGCSFFNLDPVDAKNGEAIPYQVCFINKYGEKYCNKDSFLIWGNP